MSGLSVGLVLLSDAAHNGLDETTAPFLITLTHDREAKLRFGGGVLVYPYGQLAAQIICDEGGFVSRPPLIPRINSQDDEIAGLPVWTARSSYQVLRHVSGR